MNYITGKLKKIIFHNNENNFVVALFKLSETNVSALVSKKNKTITITGMLSDVTIDIPLKLAGSYIKNEKFGYQFSFISCEIITPSTKEALIEFLSSSFISGCGKVTAEKIVDTFKDKTLDIIKNDKYALMQVEGMTEAKANKIYSSLINYNRESESILRLQNLGFSIDDCSKIYNKFKDSLESILNNNFYDLKEVIDFSKVDSVYVTNYGRSTVIRIKNCLLESMAIISRTVGNTYYSKEEVLSYLYKYFDLILDSEKIDKIFKELVKDKEIVIKNNRIYLYNIYEEEKYIAKTLKKINESKKITIPNIEEKLKELESLLKIDYNEIQEKAIITALNNNITIISGGPGTGKTTIIKAIVKLYMNEFKLNKDRAIEKIALLAPTGRASKKLASSVGMPASTIHRYLKWFKDTNEFSYNEFNKTNHELIIVDEVSMIDCGLFASLLKGINTNIKLILVGDIFQLPSVSAGLVLQELIASEYFNYILLNQIYRQSDNSYIPYLALDIKNKEIGEEILQKKDDYLFISVKSSLINNVLKQIIDASIKKGIDEHHMQVLAPVYKGENGIDNLNAILQDIYNPRSSTKEELRYGDVIYRENDKVLQLVNDLDNNVFNGDIGYIKDIYAGKISIEFDDSMVVYDKKNLKNIKHAYAITIHKSQGSEFEHVIMPISISYRKMLYNKLIYTGVSRAKKSLILIGEIQAFISGVNNSYSENRKTSLKDMLDEVYIKKNNS